MKTARGIAVLLIVLAIAMAGQQQKRHGSGVGSTENSDWSELMTSVQRMHAATASVEPSGNSDVDFVRLMLPHHQAAIDMATQQLISGKDPQMRRLAQEIIADQQSEIELMQLWLKQHQGK